MKKILNSQFSTLITLFCCITASPAYAGELSGYIAAETRFFTQGPAFPEQDIDNTPSIIVEPEYYHVSDDYAHTFTARPFFRYDPIDDRRTHADIRQLDYLYVEDDWELRAGISKVFWGVTESRHLVDIINQTDFIEEIDEEEKLGQPMVQLALTKDWGTLRFFYLPYFRERTWPGQEGRLRPGLPIETDRTRYASAAEQWHGDIALRYSHYFGNWDIGLAHFSGTGREPRLLQEFSSDGDPILVPFYETIDQSSLDLQYTKDAWLLKLEAIRRSGQGDAFFATTAGFEYTLFTIFDTDADLGLLAEYHFDDRDDSAPFTIFDNDLFLGMRYVFNDIDNTQLLGGGVFDRKTNARSYFIEAETRLNDHTTIEVVGRIFTGAGPNDPDFAFSRDDHIRVNLSYYF